MTSCCVFTGAGRSSKGRARASWIFLRRVRGDLLEGCSRSLSLRLMGRLAPMAKHLVFPKLARNFSSMSPRGFEARAVLPSQELVAARTSPNASIAAPEKKPRSGRGRSLEFRGFQPTERVSLVRPFYDRLRAARWRLRRVISPNPGRPRPLDGAT